MEDHAYIGELAAAIFYLAAGVGLLRVAFRTGLLEERILGWSLRPFDALDVPTDRGFGISAVLERSDDAHPSTVVGEARVNHVPLAPGGAGAEKHHGHCDRSECACLQTPAVQR